MRALMRSAGTFARQSSTRVMWHVAGTEDFLGMMRFEEASAPALVWKLQMRFCIACPITRTLRILWRFFWTRPMWVVVRAKLPHPSRCIAYPASTCIP